ncbi:MAG: ArnT family glycosyltransferase, partial [Flavisolibacter sp.]
MLKKIPAIIWLVLGAAILFLPFLGSTHLFDWDEVNFAEASREMLITKNYFIPQINFQPFWEKPPLFFWLQASSMSVFGVNEFAARFPNALCGMITLICLYRIGKRLRDKTLGWIWVLMYAGSFLPQLYFKSAIIDPWF